ncbi:hypothetical protein MUK42_10813, partial [Musa troglodytarum]
MQGSGDDTDALCRKRKWMESPADDPAAMASGSDGDQKIRFQDAVWFLEVLKENLDDGKYQEFLKTIKDMSSQRIDPAECFKRVKALLQGHPDLIVGFDNFLPNGWRRMEPSTFENKPNYHDALAFVYKLRNRFSNNDEKYRSFLYTLSMIWTEHKSIDEVFQEVMVLFQNDNDLLEEFCRFIPFGSERLPSHHVSSVGPLRHHNEGKPTNTNDAQGEELLQKKQICNSHAEGELNNELHDLERNKRQKHLQKSHKDQREYESAKMDMEHEKDLNNMLLQRGEEALSLEGHQARLMEKESFMDVELERDDMKNVKLSKSDRNMEGKRLIKKGSSSKDADASGNNFSRENEKCDFRRADSELDLSNCRRYACSYCFLPKNYPVPPASGMTELGASVLNVHLVSVTFGSENCPFKFTRRNKYEECLNRCEDDRFELDMWLEIATLTVKRVEELLEKIHSHKIEPEINIRIEDHFTSQDLRCLEQLYGDYGLHVVDILRENVSASLPVILTRLKQKLEEGLRMRADLQNDWAEVFVKNHSRALDHRRFYFKQQDPKTLSFKVWLGLRPKEEEEKEEEERKRGEEQKDKRKTRRVCLMFFVISVALLAECKLLNEKMDENNHLKSAAGNGHIISNMDELDKIMKVWTTFVEPMVGVFSRLQDTEINKETMKHDYKGSVSSSWQSHGAPCARGFSTHLKSGYLFNPSVPQLGKENLKNFEGSQNRKSIVHRTCGEQLEISDEVYQYNEHTAICNCEDGREEGELSPEVHFEENSLLDLEGTVIDKVEVKDGPEGKRYQVYPGESMCDVEAEAKTKVDDVDAVNDGDESSSRHLRNSPNLSETVVDASDNQCDDVGYDVQESFREHDGEEEGIDHDAKSDEMSVLDIFEGICHQKMTKPLSEHAPRVLHHKDRRSRIFYGNTSFYLLFRFHQILYERILSAKTNSSAVEIHLRTLKNTGLPSFYAKFKESLYRFLNHSIDKSKFEDDCYTFVGPQSYLLSTVNILISKLVKQLQAVASNEMDN